MWQELFSVKGIRHSGLWNGSEVGTELNLVSWTTLLTCRPCSHKETEDPDVRCFSL